MSGNNEIHVIESLYLKRVVVHDPPILHHRGGGLRVQIERTVYTTRTDRDSVRPDRAPIVQATHHGHTIKKDGSLGAERHSIYTYDLNDEDRARLAGLKATTTERFLDEIHRRWGKGSVR